MAAAHAGDGDLDLGHIPLSPIYCDTSRGHRQGIDSAAMRRSASSVAGGSRLLRLDKARGNAIDPALVEDLLAAVARRRAATTTCDGVLLASAHPKLFCPGLDLVTLVDSTGAALRAFMLRFAEMVTGALRPAEAHGGGGVGTRRRGRLHPRPHGGLARPRSRAPDRAERGEGRTAAPLVRGPSPAATVARARRSRGWRSWAATSRARRPSTRASPTSWPTARGLRGGVPRAPGGVRREGPRAVATTKRYLRNVVLAEMKAREADLVGEFLDAWFSPGHQERIRDDRRDARALSRPSGRRAPSRMSRQRYTPEEQPWPRRPRPRGPGSHSSRRPLTASQFLPKVAPTTVRKAYQSAEADAAGTGARGGASTPAIPAKG